MTEVRELVLYDPAPFQEANGPGEDVDDSAPLQVKEGWVEDRRYIVCFNPERAAKDRPDRKAILETLEESFSGATRAW